MHRLKVFRFVSLFLLLVVSLMLPGAVIAQGEMSLVLYAYSDSVFTTETTEILATLTDSEGEPVAEKEIIFTADLGTVAPEKAVTDANGEAKVTFTAPDQSGTGHVTAKVNGVSETIEIEITSTFQWIMYMIMCILGIFGIGGGTALYLRRARKARQAG